VNCEKLKADIVSRISCFRLLVAPHHPNFLKALSISEGEPQPHTTLVLDNWGHTACFRSLDCCIDPCFPNTSEMLQFFFFALPSILPHFVANAYSSHYSYVSIAPGSWVLQLATFVFDAMQLSWNGPHAKLSEFSVFLRCPGAYWWLSVRCDWHKRHFRTCMDPQNGKQPIDQNFGT